MSSYLTPLAIRTIESQPAPATQSFANSSTYKFDFRPSDIRGKLKLANLRIDVIETGGSADAIPTDMSHWFREIRLRKQGQSKDLYVFRPDEIYWVNCAVLPKQRQTQKYLDELALSKHWYQGKSHIRSDVVSYRLPLVTWPLDEEAWFLLDGVYTLEVEFQPIVASGSGVLGINGMYLELSVDQSRQTVSMAAAKRNLLRQKYFLQGVVIEETSKTLTASTDYNVDLSSLDGLCAGLLFCVRADGYSATNSGDKRFLHLGYNATCDLLDSTDQSIFGGGRSVDANLLLSQTYMEQNLNNLGDKRAMYFMPFAREVRTAYQPPDPDELKKHKINRYIEGFRFDKSKYKLRIKPGSAGTATVQTITIASTAADGGTYQLSYTNEFGETCVTDPLAYNTNAAAMKTAVDALDCMVQDAYGPRGVTFGADFTAAAGVTATFGTNVKAANDEKTSVRVIPNTLNDGGVFETAATSALSTGGQSPGWTTGSSYTITVIALMWMEYESRSGNVRVKSI